MATGKLSGTRMMAKLREERASLEKREAEARREAAYELGELVLDAGADGISERDFRKLLSMAVAIGPGKVIEMLGGAMEVVSVRSLKTNAGPAAAPNGVGSHGHA